MELYNYYSLDEAIDRKSVLKRLKQLQKESKIKFDLDGEVFKIEDLDLEEIEVEELIELFDENDVFPYLDRDDEGEDDDFFGDYGDFDDDY
jgi:hypothetical protein